MVLGKVKTKNAESQLKKKKTYSLVYEEKSSSLQLKKNESSDLYNTKNCKLLRSLAFNNSKNKT